MAFPVMQSTLPVVLDTLPALKVRRYHGQSKMGNVYCYARMYFLKDSLQLSLCAFERAPDAATRIEFAVGGTEKAFLLLSLSREGATLSRCGGGMPLVLPAPPPAFFSGVDEQGWYWGAQVSLAAPLLAQAGMVPLPREFSAAVFKTRTDEDAFGASFEALPGGEKLAFENFSRFTPARY